MKTDELVQYVILFDVPGFANQFVLKVRWPGAEYGRFLAAHRNADAVRVAIPSTHVKANFKQAAPVVEVWVDKRVADA